MRSGRVVSDTRGPNKAYVIAGIVAALLVVGFVALVVIDSRQQAASSPPGDVRTYDVEQGHIEGDVNYAQSPPVGGEHNPVWQNCGSYSEPMRDENAAHSLEHGAVWITYRPDQARQLRGIAQDQTYVLVSPYPGLDAPVVASAWGKQAKLDGADDPDLDRFIRAYRQGPQTPEPGAACTGGVGEPA